MAASNIRQIISDIDKGKFKPVYFLYGSEAYYIDLIVDHLEASAVAPEDRDFNYNLYYGVDTDIETVVGAAQQFPVMADRKLVILKEAQAMLNAKSQLEKLIPYLEKPNGTAILVVTYKGEKFNAILPVVKAAGKTGVTFKSESPRDYELPVHVKDYCQQHKTGIDDKAVSMLCDYIGGPLSKLFGELNKLIQIKGSGGGRITSEDVERNIGISKDYNNFEFQKAIQQRNYPKCMAIIKYFHNNPKANPTVVTTAVLFSFFSKLAIAHFVTPRTDAALMSALELKTPYALREMKEGMRNYPPANTINAIHHLREFDAKSKGVNSFQKEYDLLKELVFKIMT